MRTPSPKIIYRLTAFLAVCVFILANLCTGKLTDYFNLTLDFTGERLYSLSDATRKAVSNLRSKTVITVICAQADYPPVLGEILARYAKLSDAVTVQYTDPYADPAFLSQYGGQGFQLGDSDILVEGAYGVRHIPRDAIYIADSSGNYSGLALEERLTNALVLANTGRDFSLAFTAGHAETPSPSLKEALGGSGFSIKNIALMTGTAPLSDIVVIAGPERDFLSAEIETLSAYLAGGGKLMVFLGAESARLPAFENFLAAWGLSVLPGTVQEPLAHTPGNPSSLIPLYGMHEINLNFAERQFFLAMPGTRAVGIGENIPDIAVTRLLLSSRDASIKKGTEDSTAGNLRETAGPFVLAAAAEKQNEKGAIILFGSTGIYSDDIIAAPAFANREYFAGAALYLASRYAKQTVSIPPKTLAPPSVNAGFGITLIVLLAFGITLPLAALVTGAAILYRRRRR